jgi:hypothetical protein
VPDGPARNAATQLRASSQEIDRNTAQHLADGSITAYYMDDLRQPPNVDTLVRGWGYDPTVYTAYLEPPGNTEYMLVQRNSSGFRRQGTSKIFGWRRLSVDVWQTLLVHETNHALNPNVTAPVERYKSEFRAYWVAEFRGVADLDDRARQIKAHILRDYPIISVPYNDATHPEVKQQIDAHTRPDGNVTNR